MPDLLLNHLIGGGQQRLRDGKAERLGGFEVDDQLDFYGLLDGQISNTNRGQDARAGPGVFICDECVGLCRPIIEKKGKSTTQGVPSLLPDNAPTEALLKALAGLAGYNGAFERIGAAMQDIADILREREVSWATIGEALAVSRQAACKRFG